MQDPNLDTEWNDVLRQKGIIPQKEKEITEEQIIDIVERTVQEKLNKDHLEDKTYDELDELEDEEDERILMEYKRKRIEEMKVLQSKAKYGDVIEITATDYVKEINQAGSDVWVVLHLYKTGIPLCNLINQYMSILAKKFPAVKFVKSISTTCIPNYPDKNVPTMFIYYEGDLKHKIVGALEFGGMQLKQDDLEWRLHRFGAVKSTLERNDSDKVRSHEDDMIKTIRQSLFTSRNENDDDED